MPLAFLPPSSPCLTCLACWLPTDRTCQHAPTYCDTHAWVEKGPPTMPSQTPAQHIPTPQNLMNIPRREQGVKKANVYRLCVFDRTWHGVTKDRQFWTKTRTWRQGGQGHSNNRAGTSPAVHACFAGLTQHKTWQQETEKGSAQTKFYYPIMNILCGVLILLVGLVRCFLAVLGLCYLPTALCRFTGMFLSTLPHDHFSISHLYHHHPTPFPSCGSCCLCLSLPARALSFSIWACLEKDLWIGLDLFLMDRCLWGGSLATWRALGLSGWWLGQDRQQTPHPPSALCCMGAMAKK